MSLENRLLTVQFQLGEGAFGEAGEDVVELAGLRVIATVEKMGSPGMNSAVISIYGMTPSQMNQLTRVGVVPSAFRKNIVVLKAGTDPSNLSLVFAGGIREAWPDYQSAPEVAFNVTAFTGMLAAMKTALPKTYQGRVSVATIMGQLATDMGYALENNLKNPIFLDNPYLPGTARSQALAAADAANIFVYFDDDDGIMTLVDRDGSRAGDAPVISVDTGMAGYPIYVGPGRIAVRTIYAPGIRFLGNVQVKSTQQGAEGMWRVVRLSHRLESQTPNGAWFTDIVGSLPFTGVSS